MRCSRRIRTTSSSPGHVCFAASSERPISATGNRRSFIGRNGSMAAAGGARRRQPDRRVRRRHGSVRRAADSRGARRPARPGRWCSCSAKGTRATHALALIASTTPPEAPPARSRACRRCGTRMLDAIKVHTPDDSFDILMNRWLLYQSLSCRIWTRAGYYQPGGAYRLPRSAAGRDVAALRRAAARARAHPARGRRASSSRATCSTGGTNRPAAACAAAAPTTCCGCRSSSRSTCASPAMTPLLDDEVPFLIGAAAAGRRSRKPTTCRRLAARRGTRLRALPPRHRQGPHQRPARPAAHRRRRLERRHEPRRPRGPRRKHVARLLHLLDPHRLHPDLRDARRSAPAATLSRHRAADCRRGSSRRGTASGIGAAITTMAGRWDRRRTTSARSIRSRSRGRCCPARCRGASPSAPWTRCARG